MYDGISVIERWGSRERGERANAEAGGEAADDGAQQAEVAQRAHDDGHEVYGPAAEEAAQQTEHLCV